MKAEQRKHAKKAVSEVEPGQVIERYGGDLLVLPAAAFDDEQVPDIDIEPYLIERDGKPQVALPFNLPVAFRGGLYVLTNQHIAVMWSDMSASALRKEVEYRREHDEPIPPIANSRLGREVYR